MKIFRIWVLGLVLITAGLSLNACGGAQNDLAGANWVLESYTIGGETKSAAAEVKVTAIFDNSSGKVGGSGGCNQYFGTYNLTGNQLSITELGSTKMACQNPAGAQETEYFNLLKAAQSYKIENQKLTISCTNGSLVFVKESGR